MTKQGTRGFRWVFLLLLLALTAGFAFFYLGEQQKLAAQKNSEDTALKIAQWAAKQLRQRQVLDETSFHEPFSFDQNLVYVIIADQRVMVEDRQPSKLLSGLNTAALALLPQSLKQQLTSAPFHQLGAELMKPEKGAARGGFDVLNIELIEQQTPHTTAQVTIKIGYAIPLYRQLQMGLMLSQGFAVLLMVWLVQLGLQRRLSRKRQTVEPLLHHETPIGVIREMASEEVADKQEVDLFELQIPDPDATEIITLSQPKHIEGELWTPMLGEAGLGDWQLRGNWYLINDFIIGTPWRGSLVHSAIKFQDYIYRVKAKAMTGVDGFAVLFSVDEKNLVWMIGGWNNQRSEVAGIASTKVDGPIEKNRWYEVTVEVLPDKITGYLNGVSQWSLERAKFKAKDFSSDFLPGIGVATWSSVCKFKDPLIVNKGPVELASSNDKDKTEI